MKVSTIAQSVLIVVLALVVFLQNSRSISLLYNRADPRDIAHFERPDPLWPEMKHSLHRRLSKLASENHNDLPRPQRLPVTQHFVESTNLKQIGVEEKEQKPWDQRRVWEVESRSLTSKTSEVGAKSESEQLADGRLSNALVDSAPGATEVSGAGKLDLQKDHRNVNLLRAGFQRSSTSASEPFMLVTGERPNGCKTAEGSDLIMRSYKNKVDYCNLHGCKVWYMLETWNQGFQGLWARYPALVLLMQSNPSVKWFMWMDADAILTDFNFSIPFQKYDASGKELVFPGYEDKVYGEQGDWISLNTGVFLIRNSEWARGFLKRWTSMGDRKREPELRKDVNEELKNRPKEWFVDDQSAVVYMLRKGDAAAQRRKVHIEGEYVLHGYFEMMVDHLEEMEAAPPFVTHFCGCNFCGGAAPTPRCTTQFRRALNFADNQLLASQVGLRHPSLNSSALASSSS